MAEQPIEVDWSAWTWPVASTCHCNCGSAYRSHAKFVASAGRVITKEPCPSCSRTDYCYWIEGDAERWEISGG